VAGFLLASLKRTGPYVKLIKGFIKVRREVF